MAKPEDIRRAQAYAEAAGRLGVVIASYHVRDDGTVYARLSRETRGWVA